MAFRLLMIAAFVAAASAYQPTMGASRLVRARRELAARPRPLLGSRVLRAHPSCFVRRAATTGSLLRGNVPPAHAARRARRHRYAASCSDARPCPPASAPSLLAMALTLPARPPLRTTATSLALLAAAEPSLAVEYIAKDPSAVVMSSSPILNLPPGAILFAFIGLYTAATLGTTPLKVRRTRAAALQQSPADPRRLWRPPLRAGWPLGPKAEGRQVSADERAKREPRSEPSAAPGTRQNHERDPNRQKAQALRGCPSKADTVNSDVISYQQPLRPLTSRPR